MMLLVFAFFAALLTACSPGAAPVADSLRDPSNPAAAEGAPAPGTAMASAATSSTATTVAPPTTATPPVPAEHGGHTGHQGH